MEWHLRQVLWAVLLAALLPVTAGKFDAALPLLLAHLQRYRDKRRTHQREDLHHLFCTGPPNA